MNFDRGLIESFAVLYPQLRDLDFTTEANKVDVPMFFLHGRNDVNATASLVERYYNVLQAPYKEMIWLDSGHGAGPEEIVDAMVNHVLPQTYPKAQPATAKLNDPREVAAFFDTLIPTQLRENNIAGAGVAVVKDGQLLFSKGYGYTDLATTQPAVADQTLFRTDSTGKLFVWTAVMQLATQGKLDLDADVNTYLDFSIPATFPEPITLKHLMSHTAGFDGKPYILARDISDVEPIGTWLARNLPARVRPPGVVSGYSNYGTGLAAYIVERVSGMPFEQYAETHIFAPLGMQRSTFRQPLPPELAADLTTNYHYANGTFQSVPFQYLRAQVGEGAMTVTDMSKFMRAHLASGDSPILSAATAQQMHSQLYVHDPRISGFAHGFAETTQNRQHILRHEGNLEGVSSSELFLLPGQRLGVYVAYNSNGGFGPGEEFRRAFLDHYFPAAATPPTPVRLTQDQIDALTGSFRSTNIFSRSFAKVLTLLGGLYGDVQVRANADGTFTTHGIGAEPLRWVPVEPQVLRLADGALNSQGDLVFGMDAQDGVTRLYVANTPYRAYEKVAWYETGGFHITLLAVCEALFLSALIIWPVAWFMQRRRATVHSSRSRRLMRWLMAGACLLAVLFLIGLAISLEEALLYGVTSALISVLVLPLLMIIMFVGSLGFAARSWRDAGWGVIGRVHYSVVAVAMLAFVGWLSYWNLLGFHF